MKVLGCTLGLSRRFHYIFPILALCFSYVIFSKLGDIFVIPPGFVSVMWPAAGIALGFVFVFGTKIAVGIFLARFTIVMMIDSEPDITDFIVATLLSLGATLHAIISSILIRRFVNTEFYMGSLKDIVVFLLVGGPLACLVTAVLAGLTFTNFASLPSEQFFEFVTTWWVGDVFGVMLFAPLTVIILSHIQRRKTLLSSALPTIIVPLLVSITIFVLVFDSVKKQLLEHTFNEYSHSVSNLIDQFTKLLVVDIATVNATASFIEASENVTAAKFRIFTKPLLDEKTGLYTLAWLPKVDGHERDEFVKSIQSQSYPNFEIKSFNSSGEIKISKDMQVYFPLTYVEPYEQNKFVHGLDVYRPDGILGVIGKNLLDSARDMRVARATSRISIVNRDNYGFIIHFPVFRGSDDEQGREHIGYLNGVFVFPELVRNLVDALPLIESDFFLTEIIAGVAPKLLFDSRTPDNKEGSDDSYKLANAVYTEQEFDVVGKRWKITFIKNGALLTGDYKNTLWALAGGGALFNTLFLIILMMVASQNHFVQELVTQRTRELKRANEELEEFAYRTSHDLRSPIVSSVTLLNIADEAISDGNTKMASNSISHARSSLGKLENLISDILTLTKVGNMNEPDVPLRIPELIEEAISKLDHAEGFDRLSIEQDIRFEGPISAKSSRLKLIFENLISNAAKYHDPEMVKPTLNISCYIVAEKLYLEFSDNGLGIPQEYRHQMFDMFKRFHPKVANGTGLGLYLMKRSARMLNGQISYHPLEKGSLFRLIIPADHRNSYSDTTDEGRFFI